VQPLLPWKSNKYYIFWVCVCRLRYPAGNAHATYWRHLWPVRLNNIFLLYLTNGTIFEEKYIEHTISVVIFFKTLVENWARYDKNVYWILCKVPVILVRFLMKHDFFFATDFRKNTQISNFMKIRPVGAEFFHADGRMAWWTDGQTDTWRS